MTLLAYVFNACAVIIDKILVSDRIPHPSVYTFFISLLGIFGIFFAPFGMYLISFENFLFCILSGICSIFALWSFFMALMRHETSRVVPVVGALQPFLIFILARIFFYERLTFYQIIAIIFLVLGGFLITYERHLVSEKNNGKSWIFYSVLSGVSFSLMYFLNKFLYNELGFVNAFVWTRIVIFFLAVLFLLNPSFIKSIRSSFQKPKSGSALLFLIGQICGALFFVFINYALSKGSVTIVNSLQGVQYLFVFLGILLISSRYPVLMRERIDSGTIIQKGFALIIIILGVGLLII